MLEKKEFTPIHLSDNENFQKDERENTLSNAEIMSLLESLTSHANVLYTRGNISSDKVMAHIHIVKKLLTVNKKLNAPLCGIAHRLSDRGAGGVMEFHFDTLDTNSLEIYREFRRVLTEKFSVNLKNQSHHFFIEVKY